MLVSLTLVRFMHKIGQVCKIQASMTGVMTTLMEFMFVDDTDLVVLGNADEILNNVLRRSQLVLDA